MMGNFTAFLEEKLMPIATKFSTQRHLKAIRDAFICIMPITLAGGIVSRLLVQLQLQKEQQMVFF